MPFPSQSSGQWYNSSTGQFMSSAYQPSGSGWSEVPVEMSIDVVPTTSGGGGGSSSTGTTTTPPPATTSTAPSFPTPSQPTQLELSLVARRKEAEKRQRIKYKALDELRKRQEARRPEQERTRKWAEKDIREHPLEYATFFIAPASLGLKAGGKVIGKSIKPLSKLIGKTPLGAKVVGKVKKGVSKIKATAKAIEPIAIKGLGVAIVGSTAYQTKQAPKGQKLQVLKETGMSLARSGFAFGLGTKATQKVLNLRYFGIPEAKGIKISPETYPSVKKGTPTETQKRVFEKYKNDKEILHATTHEFAEETLLKLPKGVMGSEVRGLYGTPVKEPSPAFLRIGGSDYRLFGLPETILPKQELSAKFLKIDVGKIKKAPLGTLKETQKFVEKMQGKGKAFVLGFNKNEVEAVIPFLNKIRRTKVKPESVITIKGQKVPVYNYKLVKKQLQKIKGKDWKKVQKEIKNYISLLKNKKIKSKDKKSKSSTSGRRPKKEEYIISPITGIGSIAPDRRPRPRPRPRPTPPSGRPRPRPRPRPTPPREIPRAPPSPSPPIRPIPRRTPPRDPPRRTPPYIPYKTLYGGSRAIKILPILQAKPTEKKAKAKKKKKILKYTKTIVGAKTKVGLRYFTGAELR